MFRNPPPTPSDTTRSPRPGELDGVQYHFVSREDFSSLLDRGGFVEHAEFSGNLYGTSKQAIASIVESGKRCILDIEVQVPSSSSLSHARFPFITLLGSPPDQKHRLESGILFHCTPVFVRLTKPSYRPRDGVGSRRRETPKNRTC